MLYLVLYIRVMMYKEETYEMNNMKIFTSYHTAIAF
jgi:hypothetical protein